MNSDILKKCVVGLLVGAAVVGVVFLLPRFISREPQLTWVDWSCLAAILFTFYGCTALCYRMHRRSGDEFRALLQTEPEETLGHWTVPHDVWLSYLGRESRHWNFWWCSGIIAVALMFAALFSVLGKSPFDPWAFCLAVGSIGMPGCGIVICYNCWARKRLSKDQTVEVFIRRDGFCVHKKTINTRREGDTLSEIHLKWLPKEGFGVISLKVNPMGVESGQYSGLRYHRIPVPAAAKEAAEDVVASLVANRRENSHRRG